MNSKVWIALLLTVVFTLCSTIVAIAAPVQQFTNSIDMKADPLVLSHHEQNYQILSVQIAPDNKGLVFVRRMFSPLFYESKWEGVYKYSQEEQRQFKTRVKANPRIGDPEIVFMKLADKHMRFIDYGWDPVFSRDGQTLLYAHQKKPVSGLAYTFKGNEIRVYDMARNRRTTVARPSVGYFSKPEFTDTGAILFALAGATQDPDVREREIGVGIVDPATGKQQVLYKPVKEYGRHHLVDKFAIRDGACLVLRARPLTPDSGRTDVYAYELVDAEKHAVLYSWGKHIYFAWDKRADFRICPSGELEVYGDNGEWKVPVPGKTEQSDTEPAAPQSYNVYSSPDCAYAAILSKNYETVTIRSARGEAERNWFAPGFITYLAWSPDASHIALVIRHGGVDVRFDFDELIVLRVHDMSASK